MLNKEDLPLGKEIKKLTVTDLMKEKEKYQIKAEVTEELFIERLGASIVIRKPERSLCIESLQMVNNDSLVSKADPYMVYNTVVEPNLKDPQLQKEFECVEPYDIVEKIFETGEISFIAQNAMNLAGYGSNNARVKDLKN